MGHFYGVLHCYTGYKSLGGASNYQNTSSERQAGVPFTIIIFFNYKALLLLFIGSKTSDQTEGTFDGDGDATTVAVGVYGLRSNSTVMTGHLDQ